MTEANDAYRYDAFISYSHHDKDWVDGWLLPHLEAAGLRICIDNRDFEPGLPSLVNMENAVERSRKTLIVLTPAWVKSQWTTFESLLTQTDDPAGRRRRMIPLWLKPCKPPKRIAMLTYVDFTQPAEAVSQLQRLVAAITAKPMPDVPQTVSDETVPYFEVLPPLEPTHLPEATGFVGRESELAYFADKLATSHLAVITGMAGIGKTTLAAVLARQVADPNKIFWHSFHEGEGIEVIIWELAAFLSRHGQKDLWRMLQSIQQTGGQIPPPEVLFNYLIQMVRGQGYLLCFDDLQFVDDNPLFAQFVERLRSSVLAGELSFVATSRRMPEFVQMVKFEPLAGLSATDTRRLVAKRGLSLSDDLAADLHARTEGNAQLLTLAIDALQHAEDPADLIARLLETEDIERYLMAEVDEGLTEDERAVMGAVAVLLGYPGTRDAIEAVLDKGGVRRALIDLSSRYLLIVSESEVGREYGQHAIVQAFYYDLLGRRERRAMHRRAGEYYETEELDILKAARHWGRAGEYERAARLLTEHSEQLINAGRARPMLEQLLKFEREQMELESWVSVCEAESDAFALLGEYDRATESLGSILSMVDSQALPAVDRQRMAEINRKIGKICEQRGEHSRALEYYKAGINNLGNENAQTVEMARIYKDIAWVYNRRGEYDSAIEICSQALRIVEGTDHIREVGDICSALGASYDYKGSYDVAISYFEKGLAMFERARDRHNVARLYNSLGIVYDIRGDYGRALEYCTKSLRMFKEIGDIPKIAKVYVNLGQIYRNTGVYDEAVECYEKSLTAFEEIEDLYGLAISYHNLGEIYKDKGEYDRAIEYLNQSVKITLKIGDKEGLSSSYSVLSAAHLGMGDMDQALVYCQTALENATEIGHQYLRGYCNWIFGKIYRSSMKTWRKAMDHFNEALAIFRELGHESEMAGVLEDVARLEHDIDDQEAAENE